MGLIPRVGPSDAWFLVGHFTVRDLLAKITFGEVILGSREVFCSPFAWIFGSRLSPCEEVTPEAFANFVFVSQSK